MMLKQKVKWQTQRVEKEKQKIKIELNLILEKDGHKARLRKILNYIQDLEDEASAHGQLRRFIYIVSALVHHLTYGGLTQTQINKLTDLGYAILKIHGVEPITSQLAFLYGELHLALSQIHWKQGSHFQAAWEQELSYNLCRKTPIGGVGFQALGRGLRMYRLGFAESAIGELSLAETDKNLDLNSFYLSRLTRIKALRLFGSLDESKQLLMETSQLSEVPEAVGLELDWEKFCWQIHFEKDISHLIEVVKKGESHHLTTYIVEAYLWIHVFSSKRWMGKIPKVSYMAKKKIVDPQKLGFFIECAKQVERCYDLEIPFAHRLKGLGRILVQLNRVIGVDKELLFLAVAVRWLARSKYFSMAALVMNQYHAINLRLTGGKSKDSMGLIEDLAAKDWFVPHSA